MCSRFSLMPNFKNWYLRSSLVINISRRLTQSTLSSKNVNFKHWKSFLHIKPTNLCHYSTDSKSAQQSSILVYEGPLKKRIRIVKILSLSSSVLGFSLLPSIMYDVSGASFALACGVGLVSSVFLSTPFLLHWITKRYVLQLNYDLKNQMFMAKTFNIIGQEKDVTFSVKDVTVPNMPGFLSSFHVRDIPLFVDPSMVIDLDAYSLMMGYDKPLDFGLKK